MVASESTNLRKGRALFADRTVQQALYDKGYRIWIPREGGVNPGVGAMTYQPNFYAEQEGEFNALVASVPNKSPDPPTNVTADEYTHCEGPGGVHGKFCTTSQCANKGRGRWIQYTGDSCWLYKTAICALICFHTFMLSVLQTILVFHTMGFHNRIR